jgi:hypothetical protein
MQQLTLAANLPPHQCQDEAHQMIQVHQQNLTCQCLQTRWILTHYQVHNFHGYLLEELWLV